MKKELYADDHPKYSIIHQHIRGAHHSKTTVEQSNSSLEASSGDGLLTCSEPQCNVSNPHFRQLTSIKADCTESF